MSKREIKENVHGDDVLIIDGLSCADWTLTLGELQTQLVNNKLNKVYLLAGISACEKEVSKFD